MNQPPHKQDKPGNTIQRISDLNDPRIDDYRNVRDADLIGRRGLFMAEGRLVVRTLLRQSPLRARSLLVTEPALESLRDTLAQVEPAPKVFLAPQSVMDQIVGFPIHRGALAAGERGTPIEPNQIIGSSSVQAGATLLVIEDLANHDNVGAVFRNALAFGVGGVLLSPRCCDPLYRKAIRVSMGAALRIEFATISDWPSGLVALREAGFTVAGLMPDASAQEITEFGQSMDRPERLALLIGAEGQGLSSSALEACDVRLRIAMAPNVDSLNVATASGIALHCLSGLGCGG